MFGPCPTFSTAAFTYNRLRRTFVTEASTLTRGGALPQDGQVYNDAADVGFNMTSEKTGRTIRFVLYKEVRIEGDLEVTIYKPDPQDARRFGLDADTTVHILND